MKRGTTTKNQNKNSPPTVTNPGETEGRGTGKDPRRPPRFFSQRDWITGGVTALVLFLAYLYTLAPDVTLEDSGELAVASYYAGVPHPPGYPVWTLYSWFFTKIIPFSNVAFRVGVSSAFAGACACGLLALMVSRGTRMMLGGIDDLRSLEGWTSARIGMVAGWVAGLLLGFNGFMWSQAVIVEVYTLSVFSLMGVLCCLMRWMYAPEQRRYLYWATFLFGICFNNHQTLIVAAMGLEVAIAAANRPLGRDLFLGNGIIFVIGLILKWNGRLTAFDSNLPLFMIYNVVGLGSIAAFAWLWSQTREVMTEWKPVVLMSLIWLVGFSFYFYLPLTSSTNPPMNWGYPRTWAGFVHAFTRGQYERPNPTPSLFKFIQQMWGYIRGASQEFNPVFLMIAVVPFAFYKKMSKAMRAWMTGLTGVFLCLAVLLMILLNPEPDKQSQELNRVFFTASHVVLAMWVGYGLSLIAAYLSCQYHEARGLAMTGGAIALAIAVYAWMKLERAYPLDRFTAFYGTALAAGFLGVIWHSRQRVALHAVLGIFLVLPLYSVCSHWWGNERRGHLFGYWFGHDMFKPPYGIYPRIPKGSILFGGTDPGRFNPTYMIFCESALPPSKKRDPDFDRRDVYLITQNALADNTYLDYIRAHYHRSAQKDPPFFQEMLRSKKSRSRGTTNLLARAFAPVDRAMAAFGAAVEKRRRAQGIYPAREIYTPSRQDSDNAYLEYMTDAARRRMLNQLKPGEVVEQLPDGNISVKGQVAVMSINAILAKIIFEKNPDHEFFIEESFPLEWMFPYLSPYGIILKIHRQPLPEITDEIIDRDRQFWNKYIQRFIGDWIHDDTSIEAIVAWVKQVYLQGDLSGFKGDPKFLRDDWAQKAFSKLRSAVGGVYAWRLSPECPAEFKPKSPEAEQRLVKAAEFAFRQAFALCPYSPEAVLRYSNLLATLNRLDDAILITETCYRFDEENQGIWELLRQLHRMKQGQAALTDAQNQVILLENQYRNNPTNLDLAFKLISSYVELTRTNDALKILHSLVQDTNGTPTSLLSAAGAYMQLGRYRELEDALEKLVRKIPESPEAWYDLAGTQALLQETHLAMTNLAKAVELSDRRLQREPGSQNLAARAQDDARFNGVRNLPAYRKIISSSLR